MSVIRGEVQQLRTNTIVTMFIWDATAITGTPFDVLRWTPHASGITQPIVWQGQTYEPLPIEADGFELQSQGTLPRPTLRVSNIGGLVGSYLRGMKDGLNAKVTRKRTLAKYLDAINFPNAENPFADPNAHFPDDIYYVARKVSENPIQVEIALSVKFDVEGVRLPRRQVISSICQWIYRGPECGYTGPPVQDRFGNATSDPARDQCRKTLSACKARFGENGVLPTSAFPASLLVRMS